MLTQHQLDNQPVGVLVRCSGPSDIDRLYMDAQHQWAWADGFSMTYQRVLSFGHAFTAKMPPWPKGLEARLTLVG